MLKNIHNFNVAQYCPRKQENKQNRSNALTLKIFHGVNHLSHTPCQKNIINISQYFKYSNVAHEIKFRVKTPLLNS